MFGSGFENEAFPLCPGDYYGEGPDSFRGISLQGLSSNSSREPDAVLDCMPFQPAGDFYGDDPGKVKRGISLPGLVSTSSKGGCTSRSLPEDIHGDKLTHWCNQAIDLGWPLGSGTSPFEEYDVQEARDMPKNDIEEIANQVVIRKDRFTEIRQPPKLPTDSFFELEDTTFYVSSKAACEVGNHLLDFFSQDVVSSIREVDTIDYFIEADAFVNNVMCSLRVNVYDCDSRGLACEFQRFGGGAPTFLAVYQKATQWLKSLRVPVENSPQASSEINFFTPCKLVGQAPLVEEEDLTPLYDMASLQIPALQSEAAVALANLADDGFASQLCNKSTFDAIANLLKTDAPEVAYPTYHLILVLAQQAEAAMFFSADLLTIIIEQLSKTTNRIVRDELAQAFQFAVQHQHQASKSMQIFDLERKLALLTR